jgi:hypothetical protein
MVSDLLDVAYGRNPFITEHLSDRFILRYKHQSNGSTFAPSTQLSECGKQTAVHDAFVMPEVVRKDHERDRELMIRYY